MFMDKYREFLSELEKRKTEILRELDSLAYSIAKEYSGVDKETLKNIRDLMSDYYNACNNMEKNLNDYSNKSEETYHAFIKSLEKARTDFEKDIKNHVDSYIMDEYAKERLVQIVNDTAPYTIVQEMGDREDLVMSQKATTDFVNGEIDNLEDQTYFGILSSSDFEDGYYAFDTGEWKNDRGYYSHTKFYPSKMYDLINDLSMFNYSTYNYISFRNSGSHAGYFINGNYYLPNGSITETLDFDEFVLCFDMRHGHYENFSFLSIIDINKKFEPNVLNGKKLGIIGDSIAYGAGYSGGYGGIIGGMYNMTVENRAISGAMLVPTSGFGQILPQIEELSEDCDYVILEGGFNDSWYNGGNLLGEYNNQFQNVNADGTFYGNLDYLLCRAVEKFHGKKICFVIVHQCKTCYSVACNSEYYTATIKLCNKWGVPVVDLNKNCPPLGMVATNNPLYTEYTNLNGSPDGCHPSEAGYKKYYVPQIVSCLESL